MSSDRPSAHSRAAVIGSGASAFAVLTELTRYSEKFEITLFDIGQQIRNVPVFDNPSAVQTTAFYDDVYREIREKHPYKFPPPKTHMGERIAKRPVGQNLNLSKSVTFGGLTNYWGATALPYTGHELKDWPINRNDLAPYYREIADHIGIAAASDPLLDYFGENYANRPAFTPTQMMNRLNRHVNHAAAQPDTRYKIVSGLNPCAVETRSEHKNRCVYCGECMAGCFQNSVFTAKDSIQSYIDRNLISRYVRGRVLSIDEKKRTIRFKDEQEVHETSAFDKIFICSGCPATTEIILRSLHISEGPEIADNDVYVFPIFYFGKDAEGPADEPYIAVCNLIFACIPQVPEDTFAQVQVYPNFDYLWRYNVPVKMWPAAKKLLRPFWPRVFWGRLYVHSDQSRSYSVRVDKDDLHLALNSKPKQTPQVKNLMTLLRKTLNHNGFYIPPVAPVRQRDNSHYCASLPYGGTLVPMPTNNEIFGGVYVCDSSCFPDSPAVSPTFTIMANALRIAREALK